MPTPDPSLLPIAASIVQVSEQVYAMWQQLADVLLAGFGVVASLLAALVVIAGLRR